MKFEERAQATNSQLYLMELDGGGRQERRGWEEH